jgi:hypothetical protein
VTLQHLDTVIAFAVVMLGASLIITAGTQIVVSLLGLRGSNLRRSLTDLFEIACVDRDAKRYAKEIARQVLCHPLISDSVFSRFRIPVEELPFVPPDAAGKLQGAACGVPLRPWLLGALGGFFAWPIALAVTTRLFLPDVCQYLDVVARAVPLLNLCAHPWRSGAILGAIFGGLLSRWRLATAIRLEELVATLEKLSEPLHGTLPTRVQCAMLVIAGEAQSNPLPKTKAAAAQVERLIEDAHAEGGVAVAVQKAVAQTAVHVEPRLEGLKSWFGHAMDRASQRFTLHARLITVVLALLFVFAAHLDAIHLFQTLASDAQLRAQLAGTADEITRQADFLRTRDGAALVAARGGRSVVPDVYREAMTVVLQAAPPAAEEPPAAHAKKERARRATRLSPKNPSKGEKAAAPSPRREDSEILDAKTKAARELEETPGFASREDAVSWLRVNLDGDPASDFLVAAYEQELDAELVSDSDKLIDHSASLKRELARSEFQLMPERWPGWTPTSRELPGLLIAAAFLSLGAPFCYNILKKLASLRPLLAVKHESHSRA